MASQEALRANEADAAGAAGDVRPADGMAVEVRGLRKAYGELVAVDDLSLTIRRGEIFGILGANGCGKTTSVECVQGLRRPDAGQVRILGVDPLSDRDAVRRLVGSQLQESALPDRIRVREALGLFAALAEEPADVDRLAGEWGLAEKRNASFASLSGGQRQRLLVALALVNRPQVVFLDEMTTGLDPSARRVAWRLIEQIRARGATVVLVTHFMDEAERLCDRIAVMRRGRIVALDTPARLIAAHADAVRVSFTSPGGASPWLASVPHVARVRGRNGRVEVDGDGEVLLHVAAALLEHAVVPPDLRVEQGTLEDVFLKLAGEGGEP
jgi:ABC-2 type transport system ATP-binding protein